MKRIFDIQCTNKDCKEFQIVEEVLAHYDEFPVCECCGKPREVALTKAPSAHLKGGKGAGFYNDGYIVVGTPNKQVRRK